jgi:hypothetical protein
VDWGPLTIVSDYNTLPGYEWNVTAHMGRAVEDPVNQSYTKIYYEDQDDNTVDTAWLRITNDDGIMVLDRYVGSYWYIALNRSETYTFEAWDTLAKHQGATRTLQIPDADQTDVPMVLNKLDTTVDTSYIGLYKDGIDESMQGIRDGMNDTFSSVYGIMDNYTVQIEYVSDNMTAANGTIAGYTTTINAFGTIINSIPGKVQFLITYYLICLLVLVLLNR